ncbi:MAG TPA: hypothetical protein VF332_13165 [Vicinamibacterales bacterium]
MKRRLALLLAFACAIVLQATVTQAVVQNSPQTVRAAIPPQARPTVTPPAPVRPEVPQPRPETAPAPKSAWDAEAANVRLDVTISYQVGTGAPIRRTAVLTVADQGSGSLRAGNQVSVPSTTLVAAAAKGDGATPPAPTPVTSFNYRSVGMNVDAKRVFIQGNKAKMDLSIEFSAIDEKADASGRPTFPTFSQNLSLILENGKPLVVAQTSDYVDNVERKQSVEVRATILR